LFGQWPVAASSDLSDGARRRFVARADSQHHAA